MLHGQSVSGDIYESDALEAVAVRAPVDARDYAAAFIEAVQRTPEMATDHETMMSWFAVAVQAGHARGGAHLSAAIEAHREARRVPNGTRPDIARSADLALWEALDG